MSGGGRTTAQRLDAIEEQVRQIARILGCIFDEAVEQRRAAEKAAAQTRRLRVVEDPR